MQRGKERLAGVEFIEKIQRESIIVDGNGTLRTRGVDLTPSDQFVVYNAIPLALDWGTNQWGKEWVTKNYIDDSVFGSKIKRLVTSARGGVARDLSRKDTS